MRVLVSGAGGLVGTALGRALRASGHDVAVLARTGAGATGTGPARWDPIAGVVEPGALDDLDAVVHLAGESIGARRWTAEQKTRIEASRVRGTDVLAHAAADAARPPAVFVSASAVGIYGDRGDEVLTEASVPGADFLARVCRRWEAATVPVETAGARVVHLRSGMILDRRGGALARMLAPFRLGLGGRQGPGTQYLSWITLDDEVRAIQHVLTTDSVRGPCNLTAPEPVTNGAFAVALGRALRRPAVLPTPLAALRLRYGRELVDSLLLVSQRAVPEVLRSSGFEFGSPGLDAALAAVLRDGDGR